FIRATYTPVIATRPNSVGDKRRARIATTSIERPWRPHDATNAHFASLAARMRRLMSGTGPRRRRRFRCEETVVSFAHPVELLRPPPEIRGPAHAGAAHLVHAAAVARERSDGRCEVAAELRKAVDAHPDSASIVDLVPRSADRRRDHRQAGGQRLHDDDS